LLLTGTRKLIDHELMVDDEPTAPTDDYDLLTHYEAGKRLIETINHERQRCGDAQGAEAELHRLRLAALEDAVRRHRECRPADQPTFFNASGVLERIQTAKSQ
jgi:hypothetical protein